MTPLFSIITVTYNAEETIARTIESVRGQSFKEYEHIIIDGASTDRTLQIVESMPDPNRRVFSEPDNGIYDAMNKGLVLSRGEYLIFLNAGDCLHEDSTLGVISEAIYDTDYPGLVYGNTMIVDNDGNQLGLRHLTPPYNLTLADYARGMLVCHQAFVVNKKVTGFYNTDYRFSADYDWCIRCLQHSRDNIGLPGLIFVDYLNEGTTTRNHFASLRERFRIMCIYYGTIPTLFRHVGFAFRWLFRRKKRINCQ
ncbi:MAG: glycosyltransferase [Muribaculaceae bacterium]|nr:glycosyltransferase [Muribaculaceae bacterium]MDE6134295.1 glycosyltransferase [Muribaculaceae bacterium]